MRIAGYFRPRIAAARIAALAAPRLLESRRLYLWAGVLLIILPWTPEWTDNYLLLSFPALRSVISNGFFRGLCSGLGLLDIWIGFWEAFHYHEHP